MKLTDIDLFYNTPFTDFQNTIHFSGDSARDSFFASGVYATHSISAKFNMVRDRLTIHYPLSTHDANGVNYARFKNDFDNRWYYAFVNQVEYINDAVTNIYLVLDPVMTFMQGNFTQYLHNVQVDRQSLNSTLFAENSDRLKTNNDLLAFPKRYQTQEIQAWVHFHVVFLCSVDLTKKYGTDEKPVLTTSKGNVYDGITSPVDLYCMKSVDSFTALMKYLGDYPWISQNISNVALIPSDVIDDGDLIEQTNAENENIQGLGLYRFKKNGKTKTVTLDDINSDMGEIKANFDFPSNIPDYIMREQYANIELNSWNGQKLSLDPTYLPNKGLSLYAQAVFGYHNEIRVFQDQYQSTSHEKSVGGLYRGAYANNALIFDVFDDIPVLVDNYKLSKANTAHQRALSNDRTITGKAQIIGDNHAALQDRFMNALELTTSLQGGVIKNAGSQFTDEYEHYRDQRAELADKAISAPSVGSMNASQSFNIGHDIFGVTAKYSSIGDQYKIVMRYHNTFGFDFGGQIQEVYSLDTLPLMNFLKFSGNWVLPGVPAQFMQQLKVTLENGVKFWHANGTANPFTQDLLNNWR